MGTPIIGFPSDLGLDDHLSSDTRRAWLEIRPIISAETYLAGGTAVAIHLKHRESNDLDFFTETPLDVELLLGEITEAQLNFQLMRSSARGGSLAIVLGSTKIEFTNASNVNRIEPTTSVAGIGVAGIGDLLAMMLATITKRKELRDYEDLRAIEEIGGRRVEEGIALAVDRYSIKSESGVLALVTALSEIERCADDPLVRTPKEKLFQYWIDRLPDITASLSRYAMPTMSRKEAMDVLRTVGDEDSEN